eukprot:1526023-Pleurochrysis_carterae.AAC.1
MAVVRQRSANVDGDWDVIGLVRRQVFARRGAMRRWAQSCGRKLESKPISRRSGRADCRRVGCAGAWTQIAGGVGTVASRAPPYPEQKETRICERDASTLTKLRHCRVALLRLVLVPARKNARLYEGVSKESRDRRAWAR